MSGNKLHTDSKLLHLVAKGNELAFVELFYRYQARIFSVAKSRLKDANLAEEVVQEVFMKIWAIREELSGVEDEDAYVFTLARNAAFDQLRKVAARFNAMNEYVHVAVKADQSLEANLTTMEYEFFVDSLVEQLPPQQRQVFKLSKKEGLSHEAIGKKMNISRDTVKSHMARALQTLRVKLQPYLLSPIAIPVILRSISENL